MLTAKNEIISGIYTEFLSYESNSDLNIIIFPGNPGIASLYIELAQILIQKLNGKVNLYSISYAGFTKQKPEKKYSLQEELDHKVKVVNYLKSNWSKKSKVVILGHSIGGWLGKELIKQMKEDINPKLFLLFPFISKSENPMQVNFSQFLANPNYTRLALGSYRIFRKIPTGIILSMIKLLYSHASEKARELILEYFISENHILESIFYLANNEFESLSEDVDVSFFQTHKDSTILFYCADDMWASLSQLENLKTNVIGIKSETLPFVTHDFCVNPNQCEIVAEKIVSYLQLV